MVVTGYLGRKVGFFWLKIPGDKCRSKFEILPTRIVFVITSRCVTAFPYGPGQTKEKEEGDETIYGVDKSAYPHTSTPSGHLPATTFSSEDLQQVLA